MKAQNAGEGAMTTLRRVEEGFMEGMELWLGIESYTGVGHTQMGW